MKGFITNFSNTKSQVIDAIRSQENTHWFWGLRQAELFEDEKQATLEYIQGELAIASVKKQLISEKITAWKKLFLVFHWVPVLGAWIQLQTTKLFVESEKFQSEYEQKKLLTGLRDCLMELNVAKNEAARICEEHPEAVSSSYDELQEISVIALQERKAKFLASRTWAALHGLPESVGAMFFEVTPEEREALSIRECEIRATGETSIFGQIILAIAQMPPEKHEQLLNMLQIKPFLLQKHD